MRRNSQKRPSCRWGRKPGVRQSTGSQSQTRLSDWTELNWTEILLCFFRLTLWFSGASRWLSSKESVCNAGATGDAVSIPGSRRSPGGGHGNPPQNSCLENPMDRGAWWATVHGVARSLTWLKQLSTHIHIWFNMPYLFRIQMFSVRLIYLVINLTNESVLVTYLQETSSNVCFCYF